MCDASREGRIGPRRGFPSALSVEMLVCPQSATQRNVLVDRGFDQLASREVSTTQGSGNFGETEA